MIETMVYTHGYLHRMQRGGITVHTSGVSLRRTGEAAFRASGGQIITDGTYRTAAMRQGDTLHVLGETTHFGTLFWRSFYALQRVCWALIKHEV